MGTRINARIVTTLEKKKLIRRIAPDRSQRIRQTAQWSFVALNGWLGIQFYLWVRYFEHGGVGPAISRPAGAAGGIIGEIGALGGSILPNLLGQSKQRTGSYSTGFLVYAGIAIFVFLLMQSFARIWTKKWVRKGGRAIAMETYREGIAAD
jgi:nitrate/nitrite transporter NarK